MNADDALLESSASKLFEDHCTFDALASWDAGGPVLALWAVAAEMGLPWIGVPESLGGPGGSAGNAATIWFLAGKYAAPIPLVDTAVCSRLLASAGAPFGEKSRSLILGDHIEMAPSGNGIVLTGSAARVPYARQVETLVVALPGGLLAEVGVDEVSIAAGTNPAGEPRDTVLLCEVAVPAERVYRTTVSLDDIAVEAAFARALMMAGAMERICAITTRYSLDRRQFGRPIARFQAVSQLLAQMAEQTAIAAIATRAAAQVDGDRADTARIAAIVTTVHAERIVRTAAHQVHGAIGMTREYPLQFFTRRLVSWRDEYGSQRRWRLAMGDRVAAAGAGGLWSLISAGP